MTDRHPGLLRRKRLGRIPGEVVWASEHRAAPPKPGAHSPNPGQRLVRPLRQVEVLAVAEETVDESFDFLAPEAAEPEQSFPRRGDIAPDQAEGHGTILMPGQPIPEPHDEGFKQHVQVFDRVKGWQLAIPQSLDP